MMLTKDRVINQAIRNLQKTIRKGAISNEYLHTGRIYDDPDCEYKQLRRFVGSLYETPSRGVASK
jgi:hypothetical protein